MLEPVIAREQIDRAVAIDVCRRRAFSVFEAAALVAALARLSGIHRLKRPWPGVARVNGNVRDEKGFGALIPEDKLRLAGLLEIAEDLVVVLRLAGVFDHVPFPRDAWIKLWRRIFPPPNLVALPVSAKHDVEVSVAINIIGRTASFDC